MSTPVVFFDIAGPSSDGQRGFYSAGDVFGISVGEKRACRFTLTARAEPCVVEEALGQQHVTFDFGEPFISYDVAISILELSDTFGKAEHFTIICEVDPSVW